MEGRVLVPRFRGLGLCFTVEARPAANLLHAYLGVAGFGLAESWPSPRQQPRSQECVSILGGFTGHTGWRPAANDAPRVRDDDDGPLRNGSQGRYEGRP
jgi:hypothetical protein